MPENSTEVSLSKAAGGCLCSAGGLWTEVPLMVKFTLTFSQQRHFPSFGGFPLHCPAGEGAVWLHQEVEDSSWSSHQAQKVAPSWTLTQNWVYCPNVRAYSLIARPAALAELYKTVWEAPFAPRSAYTTRPGKLGVQRRIIFPTKFLLWFGFNILGLAEIPALLPVLNRTWGQTLEGSTVFYLQIPVS